MKNLLILALLSVFLNADNNKTISKQEFLKQTKEPKKKELNKSDEDFLRELKKIDKNIKNIEQQIEAQDKVGKTLDEIEKMIKNNPK